MPPKRQTKGSKSSSALGNFSLHFKDLHDDDIESLENETVEENASAINSTIPSDTNINMQMPDVDVNSNSVDALNSKLTSDPLMLSPVTNSKFVKVGNTSNVTSLPDKTLQEKSSKQAPPRPTKPPNFESLFNKNNIQPQNIGSKLSNPVSTETIVNENMSKTKEIKSLSTATQCTVHPLVPVPDDDDDEYLDNMNESVTPPKADKDASHAEVSTKEMISSVIFDSKARTQLFSNLKKNIQQYTGTGNKSLTESTASKPQSIEPVETDVMENSYMNIPQSSHHPLLHQRMEPELRKRSASDYSVTDDKISSLTRSITEAQRSSSVAMSFSSLLAERQKSKTEDSISISSSNASAEEGKEKSTDTTVMEAGSPAKTFKNDEKLTTPIRRPSPARNPPSPTPVYLLCFFTYSVFMYFVLPLPLLMHIVVSSFLFGVICSTLALCILSPQRPKLIPIKPPYISQPVPYHIPKSVFNPNQAFKGWMNQIEVYDLDTYHVNSTRSVFVTLEGKDLRLQTPQRNIPRRAVFGEGSIQLSNVIHHRIWDLTKAKVYLLPAGLVKKRVWSKKYPICIEFVPDKNKQTKSTENSNNLYKKMQLGDNQESYDIISDDDLIERIYLFGRTQRQKEEWFYRFQRAIYLAKSNTPRKLETTPYEVDIPSSDGDDVLPGIKASQNEMKNMNKKQADLKDVLKTYDDYYTAMCRLLPDPTVYTTIRSGSSAPTKPTSGIHIDQLRAVNYSAVSSNHDALPEVVLSQPRHIVSPSPHANEPGLEVAWFNVVVGRIMFDFLRRPKWANWLSTKIQKKLEKIRLPYFMEGLKLTEMDLGTTIPLAHKISLPRLDAQGIWLDMDITYNGAVQMTLETKMVLTKLGKKDTVISVDKNKLEGKSAITNSDEEDSAESSDDDESLLSPLASTPLQHLIPGGSENTPPFRSKDKHQRSKSSGNSLQSSSGSSTPQQEKRWVRIVDSITKSKYFQKATENSYIKKKLETVSNTPLILMAELHQCQGTVCVNIPPPPSDRIWYGFKDHPHMVLKAHPKLGERAVKTSTITDWIEKKLVQEFNKVLLMPNMDDIPIPLMFNNLEEEPP